MPRSYIKYICPAASTDTLCAFLTAAVLLVCSFDPIGLQPPHADADSVSKWAAQHDDWERHHLSRDMHDERGRGLLWLAGVTLVALWATGILSLPAHDPLDASA